LESYVPTYGSNKPDVSAASVGWQIRHSLKVIISVSKALKRSDPKDYKWTFNWKRSMMLTIGRFARGKVNSPKHTRTDVDIESSEVNKLLSQARETMLETEILSPTASFPHPIFGSLNLSQSQKSLALHTYHHLLIIRDIMA
jgi:hypothetical protein